MNQRCTQKVGNFGVQHYLFYLDETLTPFCSLNTALHNQNGLALNQML